MLTANLPSTGSLSTLPRRIWKCRLCFTSIRREDGDDVDFGVCSSCKHSPEVATLEPPSGHPLPSGTAGPFAQLMNRVVGPVDRDIDARSEHTAGLDQAEQPAAGPRPFTAADESMIRKTGRFMPQQQLLDILNERLIADVGRRFPPYTIEQLREALQAAHGEAGGVQSARDWPSLRRLLNQARRSGVLDGINEQVINDFAVVFQLTTKQVVDLKDIVLPALED